MRRAVLLAVLALVTVPSGASARVTLLSGMQAAHPGVSAFSVTFPTVDAEPDQLWAVVFSIAESSTVTSVSHRGQAFTQQASRAGFGTRTEVWTLQNPDLTDGKIDVTYSASTPTRVAILRFGDVHRTDPVVQPVTGAGNSTATTATLALTSTVRSVDQFVGVLTGADDTTMTDLTATPGATGWGSDDTGDDTRDGPLRVLGMLTAGPATQMTWSWTSPDPLQANGWTAVLFAVRAPDLAAVATPVSSSVTQTTASLSSDVVGDGGGTVTERGFVYCTCPTPFRGGAGVTDVDGGAGTGPFTGSMSGLERGTEYRVRAYAVNGGGTSYSSPITVTTEPNQPPSGALGGSPWSAVEGAGVTLAASVFDPEGDPLTYAWDVNGDGTYTDATGATPFLTWDELDALGLDGPGSYSVSVRVSDGYDTVTIGPGTLTVANAAPTFSLTAPATVAETDAVQVGVTDVDDASTADRTDGIRFGYDLDDDGTFEIGGITYATGTTATSATIPAGELDGPGTRTVRVAAIDKDGGVRQRGVAITVRNVAPTASLDAPGEATAGSPVAVRVDLDDVGADELTGVLDWGDGTRSTVRGGSAQTVTHTYAEPGARTLRLVASDDDGASSAPVTARLVVAPAPPPEAPAAPAETPRAGTGASGQRIARVSVTPRCLRAPGLRARIAQGRTMRVRFRLAQPGRVRFRLQRLTGKRGVAKCPPARGVPQPNGKRAPGIYRPHTSRALNLRAGMHTVTVAATGRRGRRLTPGTYLLRIESGGASARTKLWVLREPRRALRSR
jgi:hypothetical protein